MSKFLSGCMCEFLIKIWIYILQVVAHQQGTLRQGPRAGTEAKTGDTADWLAPHGLLPQLPYTKWNTCPKITLPTVALTLLYQ